MEATSRVDVCGTLIIMVSVVAPFLPTMLDEREFLSPDRIRCLSRYHDARPYILHIGPRRSFSSSRMAAIRRPAVRQRMAAQVESGL